MNLVINHCYGDKLFKSFDNNIYLESMNKIKNAKKVLFFQNTSYEDIEKVAQYYDIIMEFKPDIHVYLDEIFYEFLSTCSDEYEYVLISDSRDVILQKDPFDYMIENKKNIYMTRIVFLTTIGFSTYSGVKEILISKFLKMKF